MNNLSTIADIPPKQRIWRNRFTSNEVCSSAVVITGAKLTSPIDGGSLPLFRSVGWYWTGARYFGSPIWEQAPRRAELEEKPVANEREARSLILYRALSDLHERFYADVLDFAPFAQWNLVIGCADECFLEYLADSVNSEIVTTESIGGLNRANAEERLTSGLQSFRQVSTIHLPKPMVASAWRGKSFNNATIRGLEL